MRIWPRPQLLGIQIGLAAVAALVTLALVHTMAAPLWAYALGPLAALLVLGPGLRRGLRRRALVRQPFPEAWREILQRRVPFYRGLQGARRHRFEDDLRIFLQEQRIFAVKGAELDDETRVLIGASAAMLGLGLPDFEWPNVRDILVYPGSFDEEYEVGQGGILGMVHTQGPVVFSKRDLCHGFARATDGHNVGLHELAHVMDMGTGRADGVPQGLSWVATAPWIEVMADRLAKLRRRQKRKRPVLRSYAGTNEAEFFAVAVEVFFEQPQRLWERDRTLYRMLAEYFGQDPAGVLDSGAGATG